MSAWRSGKLSLKCSLDVLQKALIGIVPEWKDRIVVGEDIKNKVNGEECELVIESSTKDSYGSPMMWKKGSLFSDVGFKKDDKGKWVCISRDAGVNFEKELKAQIAIMTIKANASKRNANLVEEDGKKGYKRMVFHVPVDGPMKWGA